MAACLVHSFANSRIASSNPNPTGLLEAPSDARSEQIHGVAPLDLLPDAVGAAWSWKTPRLSRVPLPNRTSSHLYRPCCDRCTFSWGGACPRFSGTNLHILEPNPAFLAASLYTCENCSSNKVELGVRWKMLGKGRLVPHTTEACPHQSMYLRRRLKLLVAVSMTRGYGDLAFLGEDSTP